MQFKVPQDVQREDRIVGPLTLKQLIICGIGGSAAYAVYVQLGKNYTLITSLPPTIIVAGITMVFAFVRPLDMSFTQWLLRWVEFALVPRERVWVQGSADPLPIMMAAVKKPSKEDKKAEQKAESVVDKHKKLAELSKLLDNK